MRFLKMPIESDCLVSRGKLFQSLVVFGKNDLRLECSLVNRGIKLSLLRKL